MTKKLLIPLVTIGLVLGVGATAYAYHDASTSKAAREKGNAASSSRPTDQASKQARPDPNQEPVTLEGTVGCLQPTGDGPHDLSCAIVLTQDDGTVYALRSQDPVVTGSLPGGQRVRVTGTLSQQSAHDTVEAILNVEAAERL